ncbi:hypothetical protein PDIG_53440 [Penicillium digitatum PHI26]|uniref:Uncharacterized protein n=2 Tax=Penicillium digitatum TaxID=36651 RepID=K9GC73_PEND2|nr:hypothetical protein PDIP_48660 [Penicillium digitatum Pd1]EKV10856.1 hypothetical protein PDIG_53440 [Penicillium digitatum PHI26]EKV13373.1 hypothetical protein PDIP_48660 [Penicillium digitatum Pd1]
MSEQKKVRKRSEIKRWLRSWVFTPLGNVRIKLINRAKRKRRSISNCKLKWIVSEALTDRYPSCFFRDCNDQRSTPVRRSLLENEFDLSVVDLDGPMSEQSESPPHQSFRLDLAVANAPLVDGKDRTVPTAQPTSPHDPRERWQGEERSVLRIMNPDVSGASSEDEKPGGSGLVSVIEDDGNMYELSALGVSSPDLPAELSGEEKLPGQSRSVLAQTDVGMANPLVIEELAPQLPDLYFIYQPDPPLCCLITSALWDSSSPFIFENGICSCAHSSVGTQPLIQEMPPSDIPRSSIKRANPRMNTMEFLIRQTQRKRNAIVNNHYIAPFVPLQPRPLRVRKSCDVTPTNTRTDAMSPIPARTPHDGTAPVQHPPYSLRRKIEHGLLPPLPLTSHSSNTSSSPGPANRSSQSPRISSATPASASATPGDITQHPDRPPSMCNSCLAGRQRSLHSHPYHRRGDNSLQFGNPPLPYPCPRVRTGLPTGIDGLPNSLWAGPQCRHCSTRRYGIVSPLVVVGPRPRALNRVSASFSATATDSPWAGPVGPRGFYVVSEDDLPILAGTDRVDESIGPSGLEMCLVAGSTAQSRRYR